jgi:uncharacterized protein YggE
MQRRDFIIGTAAAGAAGLSGCLGTAQQATDAAAGGGDSGRTVTVTGSAEMQAAPDRAVIEASVEATGDSAAAVRDELSTRSDSLRQALRNAGLDDDQLTTGRFAIRPQYNRREPGAEPEQTGYEGTHTTTIEVDDVDATGDVIDTAIDGGADSIGRIEYTLSASTRESLREDALKAAVDTARDEADVLAARVDSRVVSVQQLNAAGGGLSPTYERYDVAEEASVGSTELQPDDVTVSASVEATYRIG